MTAGRSHAAPGLSGTLPLVDRRGEYEKRRDEREGRAAKLRRQEGQLSIVRLVLFVIAALLAWLSIGEDLFSAAFIFLPLFLFVPVAIIHDRIATARLRSSRAAAFYQAGLARIDGRFNGDEDDGLRLRPANHIYAEDLDVFGKESLFALLSRARTRSGAERLASWLLEPAAPSEILERQAASSELQERLDLREDFALVGEEIESELRPEKLRSWGVSAPVRFTAVERVVASLLAVLSTLAVLFAIPAIGRWMVSLFPLSTDVELMLARSSLVPLIVIVIAGLVFRSQTRHRVEHVVGDVERYAHDLELIALLFARLGKEQFASPRLVRVSSSAETAAAAIDRLQKLVRLLDSRRNQFFAPIAALLEWSFHIAVKVEKWRATHGAAVGEWLDDVADFEALSSIASFSFEHPSYALPVIEHGAIVATDIAHPLLPPEGTVSNDFTLGAETKLVIVSGSNMSGKSTFLRTLGTNLVLAYAGAPVRATRLTAPVLAIGASIRINDSLQEGASRFFAEITRLREIVELTRRGTPVLFLVDELLNGTNSHDRRVGAEAVLTRLVEQGAIGIATTHDLALTQIADRLGGRARNVHFEDTIEDGLMKFDYRMRDGVVRRSNALALMRSIGLDVDSATRTPAPTPPLLAGTILRAWRHDDADRMAAVANNVGIWRNLRDRFPHPYGRQDAHDFLNGVVGVVPVTNFAITEGDVVVGGVGLHPLTDVERISAEIGYWVAEEAWGRGVATEAVRLITRYGFEALGLERIFALVFQGNDASMRVLEKAGFLKEGVARRAALKDGKIIDQHVYAIVRRQPVAASD